MFGVRRGQKREVSPWIAGNRTGCRRLIWGKCGLGRWRQKGYGPELPVYSIQPQEEMWAAEAYGWKIDVAGEVQALAALIQAGPAAGPVDREPDTPLDGPPAARLLTWGTTYAEVDLTGQHVYMFQEGNLVWDAPCVRETYPRITDTPPGIYSPDLQGKGQDTGGLPRRRTEPMSTRAMGLLDAL